MRKIYLLILTIFIFYSVGIDIPVLHSNNNDTIAIEILSTNLPISPKTFDQIEIKFKAFNQTAYTLEDYVVEFKIPWADNENKFHVFNVEIFSLIGYEVKTFQKIHKNEDIFNHGATNQIRFRVLLRNPYGTCGQCRRGS